VLDISDSSGNIVKITVGPSATVTRTAKSSVSGLQVGDTVTVTGSSGAGGTINATAVRATAQGTTAGGGGFPGFGGSGPSGG
jgi:tripartite-type tricarboxylate transporter receptor subunit TctC